MLSGLAESPQTLNVLRPARMPGCAPCWMQNHGVGAKIAFCRPDSGLGHLLLPNDALVQVDGVDVRLTNTVEVHPLCPLPRTTPRRPRAHAHPNSQAHANKECSNTSTRTPHMHLQVSVFPLTLLFWQTREAHPLPRGIGAGKTSLCATVSLCAPTPPGRSSTCLPVPPRAPT